MSLDFTAFIRFAAHADAKATLGLTNDASASSTEGLRLKSTSSIGRFFAAIRNAFTGPSESETRAVRAFIQAIRQEYGSEGDAVLHRIGVREHKPLKTFHIQQIARNLEDNRRNSELQPLRDTANMPAHLLNRDAAYRFDQETPMFRAASAALGHISPQESTALLDALSANSRPSAAQKLAYDVGVAILSQNPANLLAIPEFKAQYEKRLELDGGQAEAPDSIARRLQSDAEVHAAGIMARLIEDIYKGAQTPQRRT